VEESLNHDPKNGDLSFLSMSHLREEMLDLFNRCELPIAIFENENWLIFAMIFSHVLADQPIIFQEAKGISEFSYTGKEGLMAKISFTDGRESITLGGVTEVI
jgi:hypothetical protein